jgi:hypothetical protein
MRAPYRLWYETAAAHWGASRESLTALKPPAQSWGDGRGAIEGDRSMTTTFRRNLRRGAFALAALLLAAAPAAAQSYRLMNCGELWYARNAIYAENGYCFKTRDAIRVFGRACFPPYGRLSRAEQAEVDLIVSWEKRKGCR